MDTKVPIRYPGGKQRFISQLISYLPKASEIEGHFVEPFLGGGSIYFAIQAKPAVLNDKNAELVNLYRGIRRDPAEVWRLFSAYPSGKRTYYKVRKQESHGWCLAAQAARTLYLNRTCFKGMWRHNSKGMFNVGYGGQSRRWVITESDLFDVAKVLRGTTLSCSDFEPIIEQTTQEDYIFLDPPYRPGCRDTTVEHYAFAQFTFKCHKRLASVLKSATKRGVRWGITTSSHPDLLGLYKRHRQVRFTTGVGNLPGQITKDTGEVLILNH